MSAPNPVLSPLAQLFNQAGRLAQRVGLPILLDEEDLLERARRVVALDDFGEPGFRIPLRMLLGSLEHEARLHPLGRLLFRHEIVRSLIVRLRLEDFTRRHPEVAHAPLPPLVVILGLPRTGTTFLHRLMARDPGLRAFNGWEMLAPVPPAAGALPTSAALESRVQRREQLLFSPEARSRIKAVHDFRADLPEEDWPLLHPGFLLGLFMYHARTPTYRDWCARQDHGPAYGHYRRLLQVLNTGRASAARLLVKFPMHLSHVDSILANFPDARLIWLHRDLEQVMPSACSLARHMRCCHSDHVDARDIGRENLHEAARRLADAMSAYHRAPGVFVHVPYRELVADPLTTLRRIYGELALPLGDEADRCFRAYLEQNRRERQGQRHAYSLAEYGIDAGEMRELSREYVTEFAL